MTRRSVPRFAPRCSALQVQRALHANQTVKLPWRWTDCTRSIMYSREDLLSSMLPTYNRLLQVVAGTGAAR